MGSRRTRAQVALASDSGQRRLRQFAELLIEAGNVPPDVTTKHPRNAAVAPEHVWGPSVRAIVAAPVPAAERVERLFAAEEAAFSLGKRWRDVVLTLYKPLPAAMRARIADGRLHVGEHGGRGNRRTLSLALDRVSPDGVTILAEVILSGNVSSVALGGGPFTGQALRVEWRASDERATRDEGLDALCGMIDPAAALGRVIETLRAMFDSVDARLREALEYDLTQRRDSGSLRAGLYTGHAQVREWAEILVRNADDDLRIAAREAFQTYELRLSALRARGMQFDRDQG